MVNIIGESEEETKETIEVNEDSKLEIKEKDAGKIRIFPRWISALIVIISMLEVGFLAFLGVFSCLTKQDFSNVITSSMLGDCLAIIGIAIAVWAGLNIVNAIDKKHIDEVDNQIRKMQKDANNLVQDIEEERLRIEEEIQDEKEQQNRAAREKLLYELYQTRKDELTEKLIDIIKELDEKQDISFLDLYNIELRFRNVYSMHASSPYNADDLIRTAKEGILLIKKLLHTTELNSNLSLYLELREAEFYFYQEYCTYGEERLNCAEKAISLYIKHAKDLGAHIPEFKGEQEYPNIQYEECKNYIQTLSAYFCNTLGEAYSKVVQIKAELENTDDESKMEKYAQKAIFYGAYAVQWGDRSVYTRNLGCTVERIAGKAAFYGNIYDALLKRYLTALHFEDASGNINNFKVLASLYDKHINYFLQIEFMKPSDVRIPSLASREFAERYAQLTIDGKLEVQETLKALCRLSEQTKQLHPQKSVGYQYACIYYRDMCAICGNHRLLVDVTEIDKCKKVVAEYLRNAEENLEILKIIAPKEGMTIILEKDLAELGRLL